MTEILKFAREILSESGYFAEIVETTLSPVLVFEGIATLGFILEFENPKTLIRDWVVRSDAVVSHFQFGLRQAGQKAWNAYQIFASPLAATYAEEVALGSIEEDLVGTRKIAQCGVDSAQNVRSMLLPLLAVQSAPRLEAVSIPEEIRARTSELPRRAVEAFLSSADESTIMQVLEEPE